MKRREIIKSLSMLPLAGSVLHMGSLVASPDPRNEGYVPALFEGAEVMAGKSELKPGPQVYQSIGVEPVINCIGTFTIIGGSTERPSVRAAVDSSTQYYVQLDELAMAVGQRLAELTGAEFGIVSAGCTAGLKLITAACVVGGNPEKLIRIPDLTGFEKTEVIIPRGARNPYDHSIRNIGVKIIMVNNLKELEEAMGPQTALIQLTSGGSGELTVANIAKVAKSRNIPILVDAAAEMLTVPNVHLEAGATVVAYSGGKALCGPQSAGLLIGKKDLLMSAWQVSSPHHGPARDNKVGKEEQIGMLAAVEEYMKRDHAAEEKTHLIWLDTIAKRIAGIESVQTTVIEATGLNNRSARLSIVWDAKKLNLTGEELQEELGRTKPRIAVGPGRSSRGALTGTNSTGIAITAWMMQPGDDKIVADRIYDVLSRKRNPVSTEMKPAAVIMTGRWDVEVEFSTSKSQHMLMITKQDGNWLQGSHKGDFSVRDLIGTIDGDQIKLQSRYSVPGNSITFTFYGTVSDDTMSGSINMGEYLGAKFTAKRYLYPNNPALIRIPVSPPLMG